MTFCHDIPNILAKMRQRCTISEQTAIALTALLEPCSFRKGAVIIREGYTTGKAYFIENGMSRSYWIVDGEEITTSFSTEGSIIFSMDEMYYGTLSEEFVSAVEHIAAFSIAICDLKRIVHSNAELNQWWVSIHQDEYRRLHRSHKERLALTAFERYREFRRQFPDVCRRARQLDIASYLDISPSTISRLRRRKLD